MRALSETRQGMSLSGIATAVGLPKSTVQRIVARGLADRTRGTVDRRTFVIRLSDNGIDMLDEVVPSFARLLCHQLKVLSDQELATLENLLGRLLGNLHELRP